MFSNVVIFEIQTAFPRAFHVRHGKAQVWCSSSASQPCPAQEATFHGRSSRSSRRGPAEEDKITLRVELSNRNPSSTWVIANQREDRFRSRPYSARCGFHAYRGYGRRALPAIPSIIISRKRQPLHHGSGKTRFYHSRILRQASYFRYDLILLILWQFTNIIFFEHFD